MGYFGYEMKQECYRDVMKNEYAATTPDAAFIFVDRMIAFDHLENATYLVALVDSTSPEHEQSIQEWLDSTHSYIRNPPPIG